MNPEYFVFIDLDGTLLAGRPFFFPFAVIRALLRSFWSRLGWQAIPVCARMIFAQIQNKENLPLTNYERAIQAGAAASGLNRAEIEELLWNFYDREFPKCRPLTRPVRGAAAAIEALWNNGIPLALVTNPIWPRSVIEERLRWAGIDPGRFLWISHSGEMSHAKPSVEFYRECLRRSDCRAHQVMMIGDSERKDGPARELGICTIILGSRANWPRVAREIMRWAQGLRAGRAITPSCHR